MMKNPFFRNFLIVLMMPLAGIAQSPVDNSRIITDNKSVTDLVLLELNRERSVQRENLDFRIKQIDTKLSTLDESIKNTSSATEKVDKLVQRVQILEEKQSELDKNLLSV